ncbi:hypothetical protein ACHAWF_006045, partial [Thalassiosira exigua]
SSRSGPKASPRDSPGTELSLRSSPKPSPRSSPAVAAVEPQQPESQPANLQPADQPPAWDPSAAAAPLGPPIPLKRTSTDRLIQDASLTLDYVMEQSHFPETIGEEENEALSTVDEGTEGGGTSAGGGAEDAGATPKFPAFAEFFGDRSAPAAIPLDARTRTGGTHGTTGMLSEAERYLGDVEEDVESMLKDMRSSWEVEGIPFTEIAQVYSQQSKSSAEDEPLPGLQNALRNLHARNRHSASKAARRERDVDSNPEADCNKSRTRECRSSSEEDDEDYVVEPMEELRRVGSKRARKYAKEFFEDLNSLSESLGEKIEVVGGQVGETARSYVRPATPDLAHSIPSIRSRSETPVGAAAEGGFFLDALAMDDVKAGVEAPDLRGWWEAIASAMSPTKEAPKEGANDGANGASEGPAEEPAAEAPSAPARSAEAAPEEEPEEEEPEEEPHAATEAPAAEAAQATNAKAPAAELAAPQASFDARSVASEPTKSTGRKFGLMGRLAKSRSRPKAAEMPTVEAPQAEVPKAEAPKAEMPKAEVPKAEVPKAEVPKAEVPKAEVPKAEVPKAEVPKAEAPQTMAPQTQVQQAEVPRAEAKESRDDAPNDPRLSSLGPVPEARAQTVTEDVAALREMQRLHDEMQSLRLELQTLKRGETAEAAPPSSATSVVSSSKKGWKKKKGGLSFKGVRKGKNQGFGGAGAQETDVASIALSAAPSEAPSHFSMKSWRVGRKDKKVGGAPPAKKSAQPAATPEVPATVPEAVKKAERIVKKQAEQKGTAPQIVLHDEKIATQKKEEVKAELEKAMQALKEKQKVAAVKRERAQTKALEKKWLAEELAKDLLLIDREKQQLANTWKKLQNPSAVKKRTVALRERELNAAMKKAAIAKANLEQTQAEKEALRAKADVIQARLEAKRALEVARGTFDALKGGGGAAATAAAGGPNGTGPDGVAGVAVEESSKEGPAAKKTKKATGVAAKKPVKGGAPRKKADSPTGIKRLRMKSGKGTKEDELVEAAKAALHEAGDAEGDASPIEGTAEEEYVTHESVKAESAKEAADSTSGGIDIAEDDLVQKAKNMISTSVEEVAEEVSVERTEIEGDDFFPSGEERGDAPSPGFCCGAMTWCA